MNGTSSQAELEDNGGDHQPYVQQTSKADLLTLEIVTKPGGEKFRQTNGSRKIHVAIIFVISLLIITFLAIAGVITAAVLLTRSEAERDEGVCSTPGCVSLSNLLMSNLDETINPCDDFYKFACGGWLNETIIPAGSLFISQPTLYGRNSTRQLRSALEGNTSVKVEAVKKVKSFYQLCMDTDGINEAGVEPLLALIERTGGWNLINEAQSGE